MRSGAGGGVGMENREFYVVTKSNVMVYGRVVY
jgi:hypothetical protein